MSAREQGQEMEISWHWEKQTRDNEAVEETGTEQLVSPPGNSSLGGQDTQLDTPRAQPCHSPNSPGMGLFFTLQHFGCNASSSSP